MEFIWILAFSSIFALGAASPADKLYRNDYVYNKKTDAFYKLHIDPEFYVSAREKCQLEGGHLMVPASKEDVVQVHAMMKKYPDIGNLVWVGYDGQAHETADEIPMVTMEPDEESSYSNSGSDCDVVTRNGEIEVTGCFDKKIPFVCKVEARDVQYDEQCRVYAKGYHYYSAVGSCYKVPGTALQWNEAMSECKADGGHLIILNSQREVDTIKEFLKTVPSVWRSYRSYFFFAGIRATKAVAGQPREFRTVLNETLEQTGFTDCWAPGEPNNYMNREDCGTIFSNNGKYNDADCYDRYGYICEKEIHTTRAAEWGRRRKALVDGAMHYGLRQLVRSEGTLNSNRSL